MKSLVQEERLTALIKSSLNLMCKTSLHYDSEVEIKGLLGITLDKKNVFLVDVKEIITLGDNNEHSDLELGEDVEDFEEIDSTYTPPTTTKRNSSARNTRALKRDRRSIKDHEGVGGEDEPKRKKRTGKGYAADGDNEEKQQGETGDLDFCVVKVEKQEDEDTDLNTSDALGLSNDAADNSQKTDDFPNDDYDNGGNEDSDNEVDESTTENTQSTSSKGSSRKQITDGDYNPQSDDPQSGEDNSTSTSRKLKKIKKSKIRTKKVKAEERYTCEICNQVFNRPYNLKRHMMKHTGTHIECKHCRKKCYSKWELRKHYEISHVKALQCELCEKTFKSVEGLRRHNLSVHVMSFKYECEICSKGFHQENQLELHFNSTHLNFRFHCKALGCFSSFENKKLLCDHKKKFHPELTPQKPYVPREKSRGDIKQYTCNKCGKTYQWASSLSYHSNVCNADKASADSESAIVELPQQLEQTQQLQQQGLIHREDFQQLQQQPLEQQPQQLQQQPVVQQETPLHQQPQQQQHQRPEIQQPPQQLQIQIHPGQTQLQTLQQVTLPNSVHHQNITFTEPNQIQVQVQEIVPETMPIPSNYVIM